MKVADTDTPKCFLNFRGTWKAGESTGKAHLDHSHLGPSCGDIGNGETWPMNQKSTQTA